MNVRDLKLSIACGVESEEVKSLNTFFDDLFNGVEIYTDISESKLMFRKENKFIMLYWIESHVLLYNYSTVGSVLIYKYNCIHDEANEIMLYKAQETYKLEISKISNLTDFGVETVEKRFKEDVYNIIEL